MTDRSTADQAFPRGPAPDGPLAYSSELGRRVRYGSWNEQSISTWAKTVEAVRQGRFDEAAALADYFAEEARIINGLLERLDGQLEAFIRERGVPSADLTAMEAKLQTLLSMPGGEAFDPGREMARFLDEVRLFLLTCGGRDETECIEQALRFKEAWREVHDRRADYVCGMINEILQRFGEEAVGEFHTSAMQPLFDGRYADFNIETFEWQKALDLLMFLTFEAMRAHLAGPTRTGDMEVIEEEDRWLVRFDPCGTGGRTLRADQIEGTAPRTEHPYNWPVLKGKHDFAWNTEGVCAYCAHCCVVMEQLPIERFGYPLRVVEPPTWPAETTKPCTWIMYKDPTAVPAHYYERVGRQKPDTLGSRDS